MSSLQLSKELERKLNKLTAPEKKIDAINQHCWETARLQPKTAFKLSEKAYRMAQKDGTRIQVAESLKNMAHSLRLLSRFAMALEKGLEGLSIARSEDNQKLIGDLLYVCGGVHHHLGNKTSAMSCFQQALSIKSILGDKEGEAWVCNSIGDHLMKSGNYAEAESYFELVVSVEHNNQVLRGIGFYNLGETSYHQKDISSAKSALEKGWEIGVELDFGLMIAYCRALLGRILSQEYDSRAEMYLTEARKAAEKVGSKERLYEIHHYLYEHFKRNSALKKALDHFEKYHHLKQEVLDEANAEKVQNVQLEFNTQMLQRETELERKKHEELSQAYTEIERLSLVASKTSNGVVIMNSAGKVEWVNQAYEQITGYALAEINGRKPTSFLIESAASGEKTNPILKEESGDKPFTAQIEIITRNDEKKWIRISHTPVIDDNGKLSKRVEIVDDITDSIQMQQEIEQRNLVIEEQNNDIRASIRYAERIQQAMLPDTKDLHSAFSDCFVIYAPKDIVSGDFYWFEAKAGFQFMVVGDCTGHGVPGGFLSMMGHSLLNQIVNDENITSPAEALELLDKKVSKALSRDGGTKLNDGMEIIFMAINEAKNELEFSGAGRALYMIREGNLKELRSPKVAIGNFSDRKIRFENTRVQLQPHDQFYLFTDGFADQFGGVNGKKFMMSRLKQLLEDVAKTPMRTQKKRILETWDEWKGGMEQVDDICMIGIRP